MKIAICSDLHLEFGDIILKNENAVDVLILSGDICIAEDLHDHPEPINQLVKLGTRQTNAIRYRNFVKRVSEEFPHVVVVAGNHEFYNGNFDRNLIDLQHEYSKFSNVYFLERNMKVIDGVTFVGGTLWTDCNNGDPLTIHALSDMMNDYDCIRHDGKGYTKLRPSQTMHRHTQTLGYIKEIIRDKEKVVVVTHHAPSFKSIHGRYTRNQLMNGGYASNLSEFILNNENISLWTHGHVHEKFDYMIGNTRIVCNPRGYVGYETDDSDFSLKIVEV